MILAFDSHILDFSGQLLQKENIVVLVLVQSVALMVMEFAC